MRADAGPAPKAPPAPKPVPKAKPAPAPQSLSDAAQGYGLNRANAFKATPQFNRDQQVAATAGVKYQLDKLAQAKQLQHVHHASGISGFLTGLLHSVYGSPDNSGSDKSTAAAAHSSVLTLGGPVRAATNIGMALGEDPLGTLGHTATGITKAALNVPGGLAHTFTQSPLKTLSELGNDIGNRYGQSDAQMRQRFEKQGFAPEVFDALGAYGGVGAAAGKLARAGALGDRLQEVATAARPALRVGGGEAKIQDVSNNLFQAAGQRALDNLRLAKTTKRAEAANPATDLRAPTHVIVAHEMNQAAGKPVEVAPLSDHVAALAQHRGPAWLKSMSVQMLKSEQQRAIGQTAQRALHSLNHHERNAFYGAAEGWLPVTPMKGESLQALRQRADNALVQRRNNIMAERQAQGIDNVRKNVDEVRAIDNIRAHLDKAITPKLGETVRALRPQDVSVGFHDPGLEAAQRLLTRYGPQARELGIQRGVRKVGVTSTVGDLHYQPEGVADFIKRVQAVADKRGLERPLYFPHEADSLVNNPDFASRAVGGGKATPLDHRRTYAAFDRGTRDTTAAVYLTGLARSIKRKHNWNLVADQAAQATLPGLRNMKLNDIYAAARQRGMKASDVKVWNPGLFWNTLKGSAAHEQALNRFGDNVTPAEEFGLERLQHAFTEATHPSAKYGHTTGWYGLPKAAHDEITATMRPSNRAGRILDVVNGKQSRLLLGANPGWNAFQTLANGGLGMLATGGKLPLRMVQAEKLYRGLSPEGKDRMDALIGEGGGAHGNRVHLGSVASGQGPVDRAINAYRNFKDNPVFDKPLLGQHGPTARQLNPFEGGFAFERFENKHFRRAVLVHEIQKQAKSLDPATVEKMMKNPQQAEHFATKLNDLMGDYSTYTSKERHGIKRGTLFYGYLRHSLNVLSRVLPRDHPIAASIMGKLGNLQQDELKKLGVDSLPWSDGNFYFTHNGQLQAVGLGRANPLANAVTQIHEPQDLLGLTQPAFQILNDQINHRNSFKDRAWAINGKSAKELAAQPASYFDGARGRILLNEILGLTAPYRIAQKATEFGPQGEDSLPWSLRPTISKYAPGQAAQQRQDYNLLTQVFPFIPHPSHDAEIAKSLKQSAAAAANKGGSIKKSKSHYFGGSSSSGRPYGSSSSGSSSTPHYFTGN